MTLVDFANNGTWDCQHAIDKADAREAWQALDHTSDAATVAEALLADVDRDDWIAQQDSDAFGALDPIACFNTWRDGWKYCAAGYISTWVAEWLRDTSGQS